MPLEEMLRHNSADSAAIGWGMSAAYVNTRHSKVHSAVWSCSNRPTFAHVLSKSVRLRTPLEKPPFFSLRDRSNAAVEFNPTALQIVRSRWSSGSCEPSPFIREMCAHHPKCHSPFFERCSDRVAMLRLDSSSTSPHVESAITVWGFSDNTLSRKIQRELSTTPSQRVHIQRHRGLEVLDRRLQ